MVNTRHAFALEIRRRARRLRLRLRLNEFVVLKTDLAADNLQQARPLRDGPAYIFARHALTVQQQSLREEWNTSPRRTVYTTYPNPGRLR